MIRIASDRSLLWIARLTLGGSAAIALALAWGVTNPAGAAGSPEHFSSLGYLPVGGLGFALCALLLFASAPGAVARNRKLALAERVGCMLVAVSALWFTALQLGGIVELCLPCVAAHSLALIGAACVIALRRRSVPGFDSVDFALSASIAACLFVVALALQWADQWGESLVGSGVVAHGAVDGGDAQQVAIPVSLYNGRVEADLAELPMIGSPGAERLVYALVDPARPECRSLEPMLAGLQSGFGDGLAVVMVPGVSASNPASEPLQRALLALWHVDLEAYDRVRGELVEGLLKPGHSSVESRAVEMVGAEALRRAYEQHGDAIGRAIDFGKRLYAANCERDGRRVLPQLLIGDCVVVGSHPDPSYYAGAIMSQWGIEPIRRVSAACGAALAFADGERMHLGQLAPGSTRDFAVMVRNRGGEDLQIGWIKLAPGCAVTELPRAPIAPGEGALIRLRMQAPAVSGPLERTLVVNHNGFGKRSRLTVAAQVSAVSDARGADGQQLISAKPNRKQGAQH